MGVSMHIDDLCDQQQDVIVALRAMIAASNQAEISLLVAQWQRLDRLIKEESWRQLGNTQAQLAHTDNNRCTPGQWRTYDRVGN